MQLVASQRQLGRVRLRDGHARRLRSAPGGRRLIVVRRQHIAASGDHLHLQHTRQQSAHTVRATRVLSPDRWHTARHRVRGLHEQRAAHRRSVGAQRRPSRRYVSVAVFSILCFMQIYSYLI